MASPSHSYSGMALNDAGCLDDVDRNDMMKPKFNIGPVWAHLVLFFVLIFASRYFQLTATFPEAVLYAARVQGATIVGQWIGFKLLKKSE